MLLAYVAVVLGMIAAALVIVLLAVAPQVMRDPASLPDSAALRAATRAALSSSGVQIATLAAAALVQIAVALLAGRLSHEPARTRLSLGPSRLGPGAIAVAALGCVAISSTFDAAFGALGLEQTGSISAFSRLLAGLSARDLALMLLVGGVAAPIAEELFFRGYVQNRLCGRWGAWPGVLATAALFGLTHMDRFHAPSAFLIAVYLGWLVHRTGSIRPAIAAHSVNNLAWMLATSAELGAGLARGVHAALLAIYVAVAAAAVGWLRLRITSPSSSPRTS